MSGDSGSSSGPIISGTGVNDDCSTLVINTNISSPQANILQNLNVGDFLEIELASDQGPINVFTGNRRLVGNIISREQVKLLKCILKGTDYQAEILSINGGQCTIQISAK